jgi:hypothetical protein
MRRQMNGSKTSSQAFGAGLTASDASHRGQTMEGVSGYGMLTQLGRERADLEEGDEDEEQRHGDERQEEDLNARE